MSVALRVLFSKLERVFLESNRKFVLIDETSSESSEVYDLGNKLQESPYLEALIA